jgi:hypothetical protein
VTLETEAVILGIVIEIGVGNGWFDGRKLAVSSYLYTLCSKEQISWG